MNAAGTVRLFTFSLTLIKSSLLWLALFFFCQANSQTSNISGIVNTYHKVIEVLPGKSCLRVADPTGLNINSIVMVLQMKGAVINTTNTASFGDTTSLAGAGNYEVGTICYIIGDSIFLFHELLNSYDVNAKVQLVQFAEYSAALVTDTVKALSWDSNTGLGGVIAIYAQEDLTLNKPIWADSSGYAGGAYLMSGNTCSNFTPATGYIYNASFTSPQNGAYKGESVTSLTMAQSGGRGAPANGGGGGNNHNNSGGGGANLSAGGIGGGNSSSAGCSVTLRGLAGKPLSDWSGTKIFSGGGGGAGHANFVNTNAFGGNGGGIIFIWANNLIGNNELISASGGKGGNSESDGAGGGGAGGTIIMHVTNYIGNVNVYANGGAGGNSADGGNIGRCYGGGGGGSGGAVYFTGFSIGASVSANGGSAGVESGRDGSCAAEQAAGNGNNGIVSAGYNFRRSTTPAAYCELLLPAQLLYFNARLNGESALLSWQVDHPELIRYFIVEKNDGNGNWSTLKRVEANEQSWQYGASDLQLAPGSNLYRLIIMEKDGRQQFSPVRQIWFPLINGDFNLYPNPARGKVILNGYFEPSFPLQLMDISGKILRQQFINGTRIELDLGLLAPGTYLVRYRQFTRKLVIR